MSNVAKGRIIIIITALLWGLTGVCVKSITWSTPAIICARSIISLIMLYGYKFVCIALYGLLPKLEERKRTKKS